MKDFDYEKYLTQDDSVFITYSFTLSRDPTLGPCRQCGNPVPGNAESM
jgi:hypothetical protein